MKLTQAQANELRQIQARVTKLAADIGATIHVVGYHFGAGDLEILAEDEDVPDGTPVERGAWRWGMHGIECYCVTPDRMARYHAIHEAGEAAIGPETSDGSQRPLISIYRLI